MRTVVRSVGVALAVLVVVGCDALAPAPDPEEYFTDAVDLGLAVAVADGDAGLIADLVASGADPEARGTEDITMLQWAVHARSLDGLTALLDAGADPDLTGYRGEAALHRAAQNRNGGLFLTALLERGADVDVRSAHTGSTALIYTCQHAWPENLDVLMAADADVTVTDTLGDSALHFCARTNQGAMLRRLLEAGADPTVVNSRGDTFQDHYFSYNRDILSERALEEREAVVDWLKAHGVPVVPGA
jgi:ankyrin repeat protein